MKRDAYHSPWLIWSLLIGFLILWFYGLGARTLVPSDESRYAEMAREMLASGDWITPRLNGLKYFEKPPLQTWMTALAFWAFGLGEWQARLWTGLSGLMGIVLVAYTGLRVFNAWVGTTAALILASCFWWSGLSHVNTLDTGLSAQMTLTLCGLMLAQHNRATVQEQRNWMWMCWLGMGLATLSKGLIAIALPGAVLVIYTILTRDWRLWGRLRLFSGLLILLAVTAPWFYLVAQKNPEHPHFFFVHEHWERFTKPDDFHREGPIYYFVPVLLIGICPWLGFLIQSFWSARRDTLQGFHPKTMLVVWSVFIFVFFSISSSKLVHYILPIFPALALLIASYVAYARRRAWRIGAVVNMLVGVGGMVAVAVQGQRWADLIERQTLNAVAPMLYVAFGLMIAGGLLVLWWSRGPRDAIPSRSVIALALTGFISGQTLLQAYEPFGVQRAGTQLLPAIKAVLRPEMKIYQVKMYDQTLPFYLQRTTTLVEHQDEMAFGIAQEQNLWIETVDKLLPIWQEGPRAMLITRPEFIDELTHKGFELHIIARDPHRVIAINDVPKKPPPALVTVAPAPAPAPAAAAAGANQDQGDTKSESAVETSDRADSAPKHADRRVTVKE